MKIAAYILAALGILGWLALAVFSIFVFILLVESPVAGIPTFSQVVAFVVIPVVGVLATLGTYFLRDRIFAMLAVNGLLTVGVFLAALFVEYEFPPT